VGAGAGFVKPMECSPVDTIPDDASKWIYEVRLLRDSQLRQHECVVPRIFTKFVVAP